MVTNTSLIIDVVRRRIEGQAGHIRRLAARLLFSALLLATATNAGADYIYNIVNYPASNPGFTVGGTITTDSNNGYANILSFTVNIASTTNSYTYNFSGGPGQAANAGLYATPDQLFLTPNTSIIWPNSANELRLDDFGQYPVGELVYFEKSYGPGGNEPAYSCQDPTTTSDNGFIFATELCYSVPYPPWLIPDGIPSIPGVDIGDDPMVVATAVPEPASLTLLVSALLGLGAFYLRRRRAKA